MTNLPPGSIENAIVSEGSVPSRAVLRCKIMVATDDPTPRDAGDEARALHLLFQFGPSGVEIIKRLLNSVEGGLGAD